MRRRVSLRVTRSSGAGRATAAVVMLAGLSFLAVTSAAVTNAFVEAAASRRGAHADDAVLAEIKRLRAELEQLLAALLAGSGEDAPRAGPGDASGSWPGRRIRGMPAPGVKPGSRRDRS
jgi:hypothetical protein